MATAIEVDTQDSIKKRDNVPDLRQLSKRIQEKEFELFKFDKGTSVCWKTFRKVRNATTKEVVFGIVCCQQCFRCLKYQKKNEDGRVIDFGTKNLMDHMKTCKFTESGLLFQQPKVTSCIKKMSKTAVSANDKDESRHLQAYFVSGSLLPFNVVENDHFQILANHLISIGAKYGNINSNNVLVSWKTTLEDTLKLVLEVKDKVKGQLQYCIKDKAVSFITDLWSDNNVHRSYMDLTFFWVKEAGSDKSTWSLERALYACKHFPMQKTGENIEAALDAILLEVGCDVEGTPVTTNRGSNIVAATEQKTQIDCACHRLNTVISNAWNKCKDEIENLDNLDRKCNELVSYVKRTTEIQSELPVTLKHGGKTRPWRSLMKMFESIKANMDDPKGILLGILRSRGKAIMLEEIDIKLLTDVAELLTEVTEVFDFLEFANIPTIQNVLPSFYVLRNNFGKVEAIDSSEIQKIKKEFCNSLDDILWPSIDNIHLAATYLDPTLNEFNFIKDEAERSNLHQQGKDTVLNYADAVAEDLIAEKPEISVEETSGLCEENQATQVPRKHQRKDLFAEFRVAKSDTSASGLLRHEKDGRYSTLQKRKDAIQTEINHYECIENPYEFYSSIPTTCDHAEDDIFDPLKWWGVNRFNFPVLSAVAKTIFVIQGSSAELERNFSRAGRVARKDRARLKPDILEAQVLVSAALNTKLL